MMAIGLPHRYDCTEYFSWNVNFVNVNLVFAGQSTF